MQEPRIIEISSKRLVGMSIKMSLSDTKTYELWRQFMPRRKGIEGAVSEELFMMLIF